MWWFVVYFGMENITKLETCSWYTSLKSLGFQLSRSLENSHQNWQIGCLTTLSDFCRTLVFIFDSRKVNIKNLAAITGRQLGPAMKLPSQIRPGMHRQCFWSWKTFGWNLNIMLFLAYSLWSTKNVHPADLLQWLKTVMLQFGTVGVL